MPHSPIEDADIDQALANLNKYAPSESSLLSKALDVLKNLSEPLLKSRTAETETTPEATSEVETPETSDEPTEAPETEADAIAKSAANDEAEADRLIKAMKDESPEFADTYDASDAIEFMAKSFTRDMVAFKREVLEEIRAGRIEQIAMAKSRAKTDATFANALSGVMQEVSALKTTTDDVPATTPDSGIVTTTAALQKAHVAPENQPQSKLKKSQVGKVISNAIEDERFAAERPRLLTALTALDGRDVNPDNIARTLPEQLRSELGIS